MSSLPPGERLEAAGDVNILLLDKTGTITHGNRQAVAFFPAEGVQPKKLAETAELSSLTDETPEGKSIVALARGQYGVAPTQLASLEAQFIPFSAETRIAIRN